MSIPNSTAPRGPARTVGPFAACRSSGPARLEHLDQQSQCDGERQAEQDERKQRQRNSQRQTEHDNEHEPVITVRTPFR